MPIQPCAITIGSEGNTGIKPAVAYIQLVQPNLSSVTFNRRQFSLWEGRAARLRLALEGAYKACRKGDD